MKEKKLYKIAFMGDKDHGCDIISTLESWGGSNYYLRTGSDPEYAYFINDLGTIDFIHNSALLSEVMKNFYFLFWDDYNIECHLKVGESINYGGQDYDVDSILFDANNRRIVYKLKSFGIGVEYITNDDLKPTEEYQTVEEDNIIENKMKKQLAIKGHATRGKEVIELLEMLGGVNSLIISEHKSELSGDEPFNLYYINDNGVICYKHHSLNKDMLLFTLEEFLEKYPFKVGDKAVYVDDNDIVFINEIKWDDTVGDIFYNVKRIDEDDCFLCPPELLKPYKETNMNKFGTAKEPLESKSNAVKLVDGKVVDDLEKMSVKNHKMGPKSKLPTKYYEDRMEEIQSNQDIDKTNDNLNGNEFPSFEPMFKMNDELEYKIPDGYEITEVSKDKVFIKPIKSKYPMTYKECCDVLLIPPYYNLRYHTYEHNYGEFATSNELLSLQDRLNTLGKLIICCSAYWKIAGEEMGLDKPWEPDWNKETNKFTISNRCNEIYLNNTAWYAEILSFPTAKMRDTFYENFKDLIEQCKELL